MKRMFEHLARTAAAAGLALAASSFALASADEIVEPDAAKVLDAMSDYLAGLKSFSVGYDVEIDVVSFDSEKLKFSSSGELTAQRPNRLHAMRRGAVADVEIFLDGRELTLFGKKLNGYIQFPADSIDAAIEAVRSELDFDAPGADFLTSKPFDKDATDIVSGRHVGMTWVDGITTHHLAFRGKQVDWQLWVEEGDQPLPLKYVITSKWMAGAPEYTLRFRDWNVAPQVDAAQFTFTPPADAKQVTEVSLDATGELAAQGE